MRIHLIYMFVTISLATFVFFYTPKLVKETSENSLNKQVENFDNGLLTRIRKNELKLGEILSESEIQLRKVTQNAKVVEKISELSEKKTQLFRAESGTITLSSKEYPNINNPEGCEGNRGIVDKLVKFNRSFSRPPEVVSTFTLLDFGSGVDHRLKSEITDVTSTSFKIKFITWCDTRMSNSQLKWIALGI